MELAQDEDPERELKIRFKDVHFGDNTPSELRQINDDDRESGEVVSLYRSYLSVILRRGKVPGTDPWLTLAANSSLISKHQ